MKQNERIEVSFGRTINTGNYSAVRIDIRHSRDLRPGESLVSAIGEETTKIQDEVDHWAGTIDD